MLATAQISVWPGLIFSSGWNWPLTVNCTSRSFSGSVGFSAMFSVGLSKLSRFAGMNWVWPRLLCGDSGPAHQGVMYWAPSAVSAKFTGARLGSIGAVGELGALRAVSACSRTAASCSC